MAAQKSAKYPYQWPDGTWHSIPAAQHEANVKAKQPSAAPAAPEAPAAQAPALPLIEPPDPTYTKEIEGLGAQWRSDYAASREARRRGLLDYGYNENETTGELNFDPNNPFSRAALLKKNYDRQRAETGRSMAATGQLYTGAFQTAQDAVNRGQLGEEDQLTKSLGSFLLGNTGEQQKLTTDYGLDLIRADERRLGRIADNPLYSPTVSTADAASVTPPAAAGGIGTPARAVRTPALQNNTLTAGPTVKKVKGTRVSHKKKGNTVTHSTSVTRA